MWTGVGHDEDWPLPSPLISARFAFCASTMGCKESTLRDLSPRSNSTMPSTCSGSIDLANSDPLQELNPSHIEYHNSVTKGPLSHIMTAMYGTPPKPCCVKIIPKDSPAALSQGQNELQVQSNVYGYQRQRVSSQVGIGRATVACLYAVSHGSFLNWHACFWPLPVPSDTPHRLMQFLRFPLGGCCLADEQAPHVCGAWQSAQAPQATRGGRWF